MMGNEIKIEVQYFSDCPNSAQAIQLVKEFISQSAFNIKFKETLVEAPETRRKTKFRGSPTILVNGNDVKGLPEPKEPSLTCRYYQNGLPTREDIQNAISNL